MEYLITKASYDQNILATVEGYKSDGQTVGEEFTQTRGQMWNMLTLGHNYYTITKKRENYWAIVNPVYQIQIGPYIYFKTVKDYYKNDNLGYLPQVLTKRKLFISYYHKDDHKYKLLFEDFFGDLFISKSVRDGDINDGNNDEYIKHLIQDGYLNDTSVMIVLVSQKTLYRKHIDWEMYGALSYKVGNAYAGIIGLHLPSHTEYGIPYFIPELQPARLADNARTGYAKIFDWSYDRIVTQIRIEDAFFGRTGRSDKSDNSRLQMTRDLC